MVGVAPHRLQQLAPAGQRAGPQQQRVQHRHRLGLQRPPLAIHQQFQARLVEHDPAGPENAAPTALQGGMRCPGLHLILPSSPADNPSISGQYRRKKFLTMA
jgi:hypothetical protein